MTTKPADCTAAVIEAIETQPVRCLTCEDTGEVLSESTRYGSRLVPCPDWCEMALSLYDPMEG